MPSCARVNSVVKKMLSINRVLIILLKSHVTCTHFMHRQLRNLLKISTENY